MSVRNSKSVRRVTRHGVTTLVIDFRFRDQSGKLQRYRRDASVQTSAAAHAEAERLKRYAAEHGTLEIRGEVPTFRAFVESTYRTQYMPVLRPATRERYEALFGQHIFDELGNVPLDQVAPGGLRRLGARLAQRGLQLKGPVSLARAVLRAAHDCGVLERLPDFPKKQWKDGRKLPDAPSESEVIAMMAHATGWLRLAIALAVYAGLRSGEVRALEAQDVDLANGILKVRRAFSADEITAPKSHDERAVPIAAELRPILVEATKAKLPRARLLLNERGHTPTRQALLTTLKRMQERHSLQERSFHSLRHFFCSLLIRRGVGLEAVRVMAGHSDTKMTARYVHATAGDLTAAIAKLTLGQ
jgi:integrase